MDDTEFVSMISSLLTFPLTFISNVFVNPATMPELLQPIANLNPVSLTTTAVRGLMSSDITGFQMVAVILSCSILIAIFAPLTMVLYGKKIVIENSQCSKKNDSLVESHYSL